MARMVALTPIPGAGGAFLPRILRSQLLARSSADGGGRYPGRVEDLTATASVVDRGKTNLAAFGERSQLRDGAG